MNREQIKTIFWLRWRLACNQITRGGGLGAVLTIIVGVGMLVIGGLSFLGSFAGAVYGLRQASPAVLMGIWFGVTVAFLFIWMIGLITELQRSETIDLQRLMHLPVALGQMFVLNYVASHLAFSIVLLVPAMIGLSLGLAVTRGVVMLLMLPLALSMVFMITAWTFCLRGWLAALMSNPRRRRTIIVGITLSFILLAQAPNLFFNVILRQTNSSQKSGSTSQERQERKARQSASMRDLANQAIAAQGFIPPFWVPVGARALAEGNPLPALLGTLGCFGLGTLGLLRAYRGTIRFYLGESNGKASAPVGSSQKSESSAQPSKDTARFLELRLPGVPEEAAAVALATLRSMLRAPEVKMAWASSFIIIPIMAPLLISNSSVPDSARPFFATGAVAVSLFLLFQFLANQFGLDRDGFRALMLSPVDRRLILLGKNLASLPVAAGFGILLLTLVTVILRLPVLTVLAALCQLTAMLLLAGLVGNLLSILAPYRIQPGTMKPTKMPALAMLVMILCQMLFPLAMAPAFVPPLLELVWRKAGGSVSMPVNFLLSALLAMGAALAYHKSLPPLGRLLQRRETKILASVSVAVE
ncbi:MAG: hypothetical protein H7X97_05880 [Opitutaceae bacterium]|nr:hypothetical protein [Verrucomicrobiales bacterium]